MTRSEMTRQGRAIYAYLDERRRFHTSKATRRGDMRYCYARMYAKRPDTIYRQPVIAPISARQDAA